MSILFVWLWYYKTLTLTSVKLILTPFEWELKLFNCISIIQVSSQCIIYVNLSHHYKILSTKFQWIYLITDIFCLSFSGIFRGDCCLTYLSITFMPFSNLIRLWIFLTNYYDTYYYYGSVQGYSLSDIPMCYHSTC